MDRKLVFRRTPKGERECSTRSLPYEPWLTLVMIDGKASVDDLAQVKPELPDAIASLERLYRDGFVEPIAGPGAPMTHPGGTQPTAQFRPPSSRGSAHRDAITDGLSMRYFCSPSF